MKSLKEAELWMPPRDSIEFFEDDGFGMSEEEFIANKEEERMLIADADADAEAMTAADAGAKSRKAEACKAAIMMAQIAEQKENEAPKRALRQRNRSCRSRRGRNEAIGATPPSTPTGPRKKKSRVLIESEDELNQVATSLRHV